MPATGPVLLVANHPNSLLDPALVVGAARRPVRFLAKAPLFSDRMVGWLVRGAGAIPTYRRSDDPALVDRNEDMFRAVHAALAEGAAVGIFPEGVSHSDPGLAPLKTGAARIALGVRPAIGTAFPIVPVGLVFRRKKAFRSSALVVIGPPIEWADLAGGSDPDLVRDLTDRITDALKRVTVNLEDWKDAPLVEAALDVWESEFGVTHGATRVTRLGFTAALLRRFRSERDPLLDDLVRDVRAHVGRLERLGLTPRTLSLDPRAAAALRWSARRIALVSIPAVLAATLGLAFYWLPYRLTGAIASRMMPEAYQVSTYNLLVGIVVYGLWTTGAAVAAYLFWSPWVAAGVLALAPVSGFVGLQVRERWKGSWTDARRFLLVRSRRKLVATLIERQSALARRLDARLPAETP